MSSMQANAVLKKNEYRYRKKNTGNIEYTGIFAYQIFAKFKRFLVCDVKS